MLDGNRTDASEALELQDGAGNTAVRLAQQQANPQMITLLTQAAKEPVTH